MKVIFAKCTDAIAYANESKTYGVFHSDVNNGNDTIHVHDCCEIFFCVKGSGNMFIDEKVYKLNAGDLVVMNQFEAHQISPDANTEFERYALHIHPSYLYNVSTEKTDLARCFKIRNASVSHKSTPTKDKFERLKLLFEKLASQADFGDDILKNLSATEIITLTNECFKKQNKEYTYHSPMENNTVDIAIEYINANYSSTLNLELVAKNSYVSVNEICRLFRKYLGTTVSKYIMGKRISEAKKMLKGGFTVLQTSESCGFADYTSFIRAFKRTVGVAPGKYKKEE